MSEGLPHSEKPASVLLNSPTAQIELARKAFPGFESNELMKHWILDKQPDGYSMAEHFRGFVEDPEHAAERINPNDSGELDNLLEKIKLHPPTLH